VSRYTSPHEAWNRRRRLCLPETIISPRSRELVDQYVSRLPQAVIGRRYGDSLFHPAPGWWRYSFSPYLTAIANLDLTPSSVLDIGCGDGLITNFYAFIYPQAQVIALDVCGLCLITTRTIAARLGLKNLQIVQGDASNLRSLVPGRTFDLVLARAFSPFMNRCACGRSLGDPIDELHGNDKAARIIQAIQHILSPANGKFISTQNWSGPAELWCWASTLARAGLRVDWTLSQPIRTDRRRWSMLVSQVAPASAGVSMTDILAFLVDAEVQDTGRGPPVTGYMAEALFNVLVTSCFIFGFQATQQTFLIRRELHHAGAVLVSYDYTNGNERELRLWPRRHAGHLRSQLEEEADALRTQGSDVLRFVPRAEESDATEDTQ
jgi:SAM-dependent methyltransferase